MLWAADARGRAVYVAADWESLSGQGLIRPEGLEWAPIVHPDDREIVLKYFRHAVAERCPFVLKFRIVRPDGTHVWVAFFASPVLSPEDTRFVGFCGAFDAYDDEPELVKADVHIGDMSRLDPPASPTSSTMMEAIADRTIATREMAGRIEEHALVGIFDVALMHIGFRLASGDDPSD